MHAEIIPIREQGLTFVEVESIRDRIMIVRHQGGPTPVDGEQATIMKCKACGERAVGEIHSVSDRNVMTQFVERNLEGCFGFNEEERRIAWAEIERALRR